MRVVSARSEHTSARPTKTSQHIRQSQLADSDVPIFSLSATFSSFDFISSTNVSQTRHKSETPNESHKVLPKECGSA